MADKTYRFSYRGVSPAMFEGFSISLAVAGHGEEFVDITIDESDLSALKAQLDYNTVYDGSAASPPESSSAAGRAMPARVYRTEVFSGSATVTADVESAHLSSGWTTGTLTLPALSAVPVGHRVVFCDAHGRLLIAVRTLTIAGNGSDTVNGASSVSAARTYCRLVVEATAGGWAVNSNLL